MVYTGYQGHIASVEALTQNCRLANALKEHIQKIPRLGDFFICNLSI